MLNKIKIVFSILVIIIFSSTLLNAQDSSIQIEKSLLQKLIEKTDKYLLLKAENGNVYALDSQRNTIYPSGYTAHQNEVFYVYDINYLKQLIQTSQNRLAAQGDTLTLQTNGWPGCPPNCP